MHRHDLLILSSSRAPSPLAGEGGRRRRGRGCARPGAREGLTRTPRARTISRGPSRVPIGPRGRARSGGRGILGAEIVAGRRADRAATRAAAMRSGPSMAAISCSTRRQLKRSGGPSGISAIASIGSGPLEQAKRPRRRACAQTAPSPLLPSSRALRPSVAGARRRPIPADAHRRAPAASPRGRRAARSTGRGGRRDARPLGLVRAFESACEGASGSATRQERRMQVDAIAGVEFVFARARRGVRRTAARSRALR